MFTPNISMLPEPKKKLLPMLSGCKKFGFVLYGGTALSLRLGHRKSVDFDFFSSKPLDIDHVNLFTSLPFLRESKVLQKEKNTLTFETTDRVKISFFGGINFGCVESPELTNDVG